MRVVVTGAGDQAEVLPADPCKLGWTSGAGHSGVFGLGLQFSRARGPGQTGGVPVFPSDTPVTSLSRKKGDLGKGGPKPYKNVGDHNAGKKYKPLNYTKKCSMQINAVLRSCVLLVRTKIQKARQEPRLLTSWNDGGTHTHCWWGFSLGQLVGRWANFDSTW